MSNFNWTCPFCEHAAVITSDRHSVEGHYFEHGYRGGKRVVTTWVIVCPNQYCREFTLGATLRRWDHVGPTTRRRREPEDEILETFALIPQANVKSVPDYVPQAIRDDHREACLIRDLSPKASASLARRCLQGMIRHRWEIEEDNLNLEIQALPELIDPATWKAIDAVRQMGNIGAHMEKDVDLIVEIDEGEAGLLIQLIETLIADWYVSRYEREQRLAAIVTMNAAKQAQRMSVDVQAEPSEEVASEDVGGD